MKLNDLTGRTFERLTVLGRAPGPGRRTNWFCRCECGAEKVVCGEKLVSGKTRSCGCLAVDLIRKRSIKHGGTLNRKPTVEYKAWCHAKARCNNPDDEKYPCYGGRGIRMDPLWENDFGSFLAELGHRPPATTLDRIDVNGHYEPGNCRWATSREQCSNKTDNHYVILEGRRMILKHAAEELGVDYKNLHAHIKYKGKTFEEAAAYLVAKLPARGSP